MLFGLALGPLFVALASNVETFTILEFRVASLIQSTLRALQLLIIVRPGLVWGLKEARGVKAAHLDISLQGEIVIWFNFEK